ncbi:hypothetical protein QL285_034084 [Trifolium repens]|nr:hypothetical protein QL285_034084 [Trifolium repens]
MQTYHMGLLEIHLDPVDPQMDFGIQSPHPHPHRHRHLRPRPQPQAQDEAHACPHPTSRTVTAEHPMVHHPKYRTHLGDDD